MARRKRSAPQFVLLASTLVVGLLAWTPDARGQEPPQAPGEPSFLNMEHVFNFDPSPEGGDVYSGTDLAFWTATVPLRDANGEKLLDAEGNEILGQRDFAVVGGQPWGAHIFDITDPESATLVTQVDCNQTRNDPAVKMVVDTAGNERWLLALADDDFGGPPCIRSPIFGPRNNAGLSVFDVTDPYEWSALYTVQFPGGAHNFTFHPTEPFGWASNGDLPGALPPPALGQDLIPIIDFTDPDAPRVSQVEFALGSPHDLEFSPDGERAYVAAENHYQIWDSTDPANPTMVAGPESGTTVNPGTYAHGAFVNPEKTIMVTNNESLALGGFFVAGSGVCPGEGLGFYDIASDESHPIPLGYFVPPVIGRTDERACTSHFGNVAPNGHVMSVAWYIAGARVVDFSNPSVPVEVAHAVMEDAEAWSAKTYKGPYLYVGDIVRGFDIFKWTGEGPAPWETPTEPAP